MIAASKVQELKVSDEFNRMPAAKKIIELLSSEVRISPLIIDGDWGAGKTVFCKKLIELARDNTEGKFKPIYIDAFKADHADQPLMTLLAVILNELPAEKHKSIIEKVLPALKFGLKAAGKAGLCWLLRMNADQLSEEVEKAAKEIGEATIDKAVEEMLVEHMEAEKSLSALREALDEISKQMPLVIFVDELDRCRPDFAVRMLEIIKHVFDLDGVQFVLVTNTQQLIASIRHCYGEEINAQRYLDKFIGFCFKLPSRFSLDGNNEKSFSASQLYFKNMVANSSVLSGDTMLSSSAEIMALINKLIKYKQLSLREVETFVRYFEVYHVISSKRGLRSQLQIHDQVLTVYAVYCFCFYSSLANDIANGTFDLLRIAESIGVEKFSPPEANEGRSSLRSLAGLLLFDQPDIWSVYKLAIPTVINDYNENIVSKFQLAQNMSSHRLRINLVSDFLKTFHFVSAES
ncbi:hypothetical protein B0T49_15560 [Chromobacterium violaceum]|nr:hypothetical protein B0T48_12630 [Chromobacterium violaceum]OQS48409.1 hypothetical protein B0T49_15560 [Chromobacterium violaceum]